MPATAMTPTARFNLVENLTFVLTPTVASLTGAATRGEINAGIAIEAELQSYTGFTETASKIDTPDFGSRRVSSIPGLINIADSAITTYDDLEAVDISAELSQDDEVCVLVMRRGDNAGLPMTVAKCVVNAVTESTDQSGAATTTVAFTVRHLFPGVTIPA